MAFLLGENAGVALPNFFDFILRPLSLVKSGGYSVDSLSGFAVAAEPGLKLRLISIASFLTWLRLSRRWFGFSASIFDIVGII